MRLNSIDLKIIQRGLRAKQNLDFTHADFVNKNFLNRNLHFLKPAHWLVVHSIALTNLKTLYNNDRGGKLVSSSITSFYRQNISDSISVKIVLEGQEMYRINGRQYRLEKNQFLIHDKNELVETKVQSNVPTKGICLFLNRKIIEELVFQKTCSLEEVLNNHLGTNKFKFTHGVYSLNSGHTGAFISQYLNTLLLDGKSRSEFDYEQFFYGLGESLVSDQFVVEDALKNISTAKKTTKEELFRRVFKVKLYIDENFNQNISLDDMATEAFLSKFHFVRTFKQLFNYSPYQYLIQKRVNLALELLSKDYSQNETSLLAGFPDVRNMRRILNKHRVNKQ